MQTFLPVADFAESAAILDYKRLGKQRVETMQIYNTISGASRAWGNHPMIRMWQPYPRLLLEYGKIMTLEWISRGYNDKMLSWYNKAIQDYVDKYDPGTYLDPFNKSNLPSWLGDERLHSSHRAALLWKHLSFYQRLGWAETPKLDYYWPV